MIQSILHTLTASQAAAAAVLEADAAAAVGRHVTFNYTQARETVSYTVSSSVKENFSSRETELTARGQAARLHQAEGRALRGKGGRRGDKDSDGGKDELHYGKSLR